MKKHPTLKTLKQGQTLYAIYPASYMGGKYYVDTVYVGEDEVLNITRNMVKTWMEMFGNNYIYNSRKKAVSRCKMLNQTDTILKVELKRD